MTVTFRQIAQVIHKGVVRREFMLMSERSTRTHMRPLRPALYCSRCITPTGRLWALSQQIADDVDLWCMEVLEAFGRAPAIITDNSSWCYSTGKLTKATWVRVALDADRSAPLAVTAQHWHTMRLLAKFLQEA